MSQRIFTVLTIDGGGIRGLMTARLLQEIEDRTGKPISELYDLIVGSSTGSIVVGCLTAPSKDDPTKPRYTAKETMDFYVKDGETVFPPDRYRQLRHLLPGMNGFFDPTAFEKILDEQLGDLTMSDSLNYIMIAGTDMKKFRPVWMSNFKDKGKREDFTQKWESLKLKDAIRASASAPTVFPAKYIYNHPNKNNPAAQERHAFLDGSLFASTIARRAYTQAKKLATEGSRIVVTSLGTGAMEPNLTPDQLNQMSMLDWVRNARGASIFNVSVEMTMQDIMNDLREELGDDLYRFNVTVDPDHPDCPDMSLTNAKASNIEKLLKIADKMIDTHDEQIDRLCEVLLARHHIEQQYEISSDSFVKLTEMLNGCETSTELGKLYAFIVQYANDDEELKVSSKNQEIYELSSSLQPLHIKKLEGIYNVHLEALVDAEVQEKKMKSFWSRFNIFAKKKQPTPKNDNVPSKPEKKQKGQKPR